MNHKPEPQDTSRSSTLAPLKAPCPWLSLLWPLWPRLPLERRNPAASSRPGRVFVHDQVGMAELCRCKLHVDSCGYLDIDMFGQESLGVHFVDPYLSKQQKY